MTCERTAKALGRVGDELDNAIAYARLDGVPIRFSRRMEKIGADLQRLVADMVAHDRTGKQP